MAKKRSNPDYVLTKVGLTLPPDLLEKVDSIASFTRSSRSAVVSALLSDTLYDVWEDLQESLHVWRSSLHSDDPSSLELGAVFTAFLVRLHSRTGSASGDSSLVHCTLDLGAIPREVRK